MADDPAFIWDQRPAPSRRPPRPTPTPTPPTPVATAGEAPRDRITLREAEHRFGVTVSTLRAWARRGVIDAVMDEGSSGKQWTVTPESVAHHLSRSSRTTAGRDRSRGRVATGPTGDGSAMLVPRDAWDKLLDQLGNLHEAGLLLAEARERAAKAETEAAFLRERLAEMRAERGSPPEVDRGGGPSVPHRRRRWWQRG